MARSIRSTARFFGHVLRDVAGSLRNRWRRFQDRLSGTNDQLVIGVDVFPFTERMTGVGWYEWNLLEALARREDGLTYNLYAHTFLAPADPPAPELPDGRHLRMRAHQLPADLALPIGPTLALLRVFVEPLLRLLDHNDVLWAPNFFIPKSQMPYGRAMVATVHDLAFEAMPETVAEETLALLHRHLPETLFQSDRLIAVSDATAGDLKEYLSVNPRRIHTIHEGLEIGFVEPDSNPSNDPTLPDRYLLFVSTLEPRKNIAGVLEAFELVSGWGYDGSLVLVGKWGWHTEAIRRGMEASPVIGRILHMDYVERTQLPRLYRNCDALLFPSWMEGFGLPLVEAMACGAPVITSGRSAMPEVAGPAAIYVDPANPHTIASAVEALVSDRQHRERLVALGKDRATRFSWDRAAAATAETLRQAAGRDGSGGDEYRV